MITTIKAGADYPSDEKASIIISDEGLDNDNFVSLEARADGKTVFATTISIDELQSALAGFDCLRALRVERDYMSNMKEEYTNEIMSRALKYGLSWVASEKDADMFWINSYREGRKDATVSFWELKKEKPNSPKIRYYPAYSKEYFIEKILPQLFVTPKHQLIEKKCQT